MKRGIVWEYDPRMDMWYINGEVKIIKETERAIKIRKLFRSRWIPKRAIGIRIEEIGSQEVR